MATRSLLVRGKGKTILVDCGLGKDWSSEERDRYGIDYSQGNMDAALKSKGLRRQDVTDVVITHLHFDHVGGAMEMGDGPTFPRAKYYVHKEQLHQCHCPTPKDRASFMEAFVSPLEGSGSLQVVSEPIELAPGVKTWISNGHTKGQQLLVIGEGDQNLIFCGDMIPMSAHLPVAWVMGYDLFPVVTMEEKEEILARAEKENWVIAFCHDPEVAACEVIKDRGKYRRGKEIIL